MTPRDRTRQDREVRLLASLPPYPTPKDYHPAGQGGVIEYEEHGVLTNGQPYHTVAVSFDGRFVTFVPGHLLEEV